LTNPKIERKKSEIAKTETRLEDLRNKLRVQKQDLTALENEEIIALFRRERFNEDDLTALVKSKQQAAPPIAAAEKEDEELA